MGIPQVVYFDLNSRNMTVHDIRWKELRNYSILPSVNKVVNENFNVDHVDVLDDVNGDVLDVVRMQFPTEN